MELTEGCVAAMDGIAALLRGDLGTEAAAALQAHVAACARCRSALADAGACAAHLREALPGGAADAEGPRDPAAWERSLFLRLLAAEREGGPGHPADARNPVWARLAAWLGGSGPIRAIRSEGEWAPWPHHPWSGASPR